MSRIPERFWPRYAPLAATGLIGVAATVPEQVRIAESVLPYMDHATGGMMPPRELLIAASVLQPACLVLICAALGAALAHRYGLISVLAHRAGMERFRAGLPAALISGLLLGLLFLLADRLVFRALEPEFFENAAALAGSPAESLLTGVFYGGLSEEIMARWGLIAVFCWIACRFAGSKDECSTVATWYAILLAAVLFALGHLPAAQFYAPLTDMLILRVMLLNTAAGVVFGWLFRRYTLESAMLSHAGVHVVMFVAALGGWG
jgi:membrane protease YdiL (CAAX protease family)